MYRKIFLQRFLRRTLNGLEFFLGIFKFTDINLAREAKNRLADEYIDQTKYTKACETLDNGFEDAFQYTVLGNSHSRLKSTNLLERLNQEVRRREKSFESFLTMLQLID